MFLIKRQDGQVVSFSFERPASVSDAHILEEIDLTFEQVEEMKQAQQVRIVNGELILTPQEEDTNPEIKTLIEKMVNQTITFAEKDRALLLLLQKTQS